MGGIAMVLPRIFIAAIALAFCGAASPVDTIPIVPGSGIPFHVTVTDLKDNGLAPEVLNWQVTPGRDIGVIPEGGGFDFSAPISAASGMAEVMWTYKPNPKISIKKPIVVKEHVTGL